MKDIEMNVDDGYGLSWRPLYRAGAIAALAYLIMILVPLVLLIVEPQAPISGGAAILEFIAAHRAVYLTEYLCFVGLCLPAIVLFVALGAALVPLGKSMAVLGAVIGVGSEVMALAYGSSPPSLNGALLSLADRYAAANEALRPSIANAAESLAAYANGFTLIGVVTALGILLLSLHMTKGVFPRSTAILGIVTGALGIPLEAFRDMLGPVYALYGLLLPVWTVAAGLGLLKSSRSIGRSPKGTIAAVSP